MPDIGLGRGAALRGRASAGRAARADGVEPSTARVLVIDLSAASALGRELEAALRARWEVVSSTPAEGATTIPLPRGVIAAFLVVDRPIAERIAEWASALRRRDRDLPVLIAAGEGAPGELARLQEHGVSDFVLHPFHPSDVHARILRLPGHPGGDPLVERLKAKLGLKRLIGQSAAFVEVVQRIAPIAACDANVLLTGETGTGKEVLRPRDSPPRPPLGQTLRPGRTAAPAGLELVENELFGHTAEAFTGAAQARQGLIHAGRGRNALSRRDRLAVAAAQVKLLRFLQEKEYRALGSTQVRRADLRLIAATNARIEDEVERGRLRRDLYYRLNVLPISLPPLRERAEDVLLLSHHFLARHAVELERPLPQLTPGARQALLEHDWPGNVRELEHVMERALLLTADPQWIDRTEILLALAANGNPAGSFQQAKKEAVARFERRYIEQLLLAHGGNISHAARAAGKNRRAFFELIRKHAIDARRFCQLGETAAGFALRRRPATSV